MFSAFKLKFTFHQCSLALNRNHSPPHQCHFCLFTMYVDTYMNVRVCTLQHKPIEQTDVCTFGRQVSMLFLPAIHVSAVVAEITITNDHVTDHDRGDQLTWQQRQMTSAATQPQQQQSRHTRKPFSSRVHKK